MVPVNKKKKVDYEALKSPFMRIPRMDVETARDLIDLGFRECYELYGCSAEVLFTDLSRKKGNIPRERLYKFRLAIYYSENEEIDGKKLDLTYWMY